MLTGQILLQLIVILVVTQVFGNLSRRIGQPWVIGEILAGLALGVSLLGAFWPGLSNFIFPSSSLPTLQTLGDIGLVLYMFSLGSRLDMHKILWQSRRAAFVSVAGICLPLALGVALGFFLFPTFAGQHATLFSFVLLIGVSMSITAFPVLARFLAEKNMLGTKIGILALSSASIDDVVAWCLLAFVISVINDQGFLSTFFNICLIVAYVGAMFFLIRPLLKYLAHKTQSKQVLLVASFLILLLSAYVTTSLGIHPIFGAFLAGVILPRKLTLTEQINNMDKINSILFLPLYFVLSGLRTHIGLIQGVGLWTICLVILLIACLGKFIGGAGSVRVTGGSWHDAFSLGALMNTRGLVELIVLNIGYDLGVISPTLFAILVIMAIVTTMMAAPILHILNTNREKTSPFSSQNVEISHSDIVG